MSEIWRFTGNPENWLTAIGISKWALNDNNKSLWQEDIRAGDVALFHSTRRSEFNDRAVSSVIGFGYVGDAMAIKNEFWWVQEVRDQQNHWPYVVPLKEVYLFSETKNIDFNTPVDKKPPGQVGSDIDKLIAKGMAVHALNEKASNLDPNCPNFPVNGSVSRVNKIFEELILEQSQDLFTPGEAQTTDLLEARLTKSMDEKLSRLDKATILAQAKAFDNTGAESHRMTPGSHRVRIESQLQKRRVAALEDYTCQVCAFRYEYVRNNGKKGWIIQVDHILEKRDNGQEKLDNLWVLCPNCHCKKTYGIIKINPKTRTITEDGSEFKLIRDNHLFI